MIIVRAMPNVVNQIPSMGCVILPGRCGEVTSCGVIAPFGPAKLLIKERNIC
jgi:hypothetical protein